MTRTGAYPIPTPFVVGSEGAGVVTSVGSGVTSFQEGTTSRGRWCPAPDTPSR